MGSMFRKAFVYLTLLLALTGSGCAYLEHPTAGNGPTPPIDTASGRTGGGDGGGGGSGGY